MELKKILEPILIKQVIQGSEDIQVKGIEFDSRKVKQGYMYVCFVGNKFDGHHFVKEVIQKGAVAIVCEKKIEVPEHITLIQVPETRRIMNLMLDIFYQHPTHQFKLIGVTGTNGKTSTTNLIEQILHFNGFKTGLIGTIHMRIGDYIEEVDKTTPEITDLQRYFQRMIDEKVEYAVMEVSSHSLDLGRVKGCRFKSSVFTNLTQDHLDYHKTMETYRDTKGLLFSRMGNTYDTNHLQFSVLNIDDPASSYYKSITSSQVITYGIDNVADVRATHVRVEQDGTRFLLESFAGNTDIHLKMIGKFSVYNALAAISTCLAEGLSLHSIKTAIERIEGVRGRFESIYGGQNYNIVVDYAHTPDGVENVLKTAKELTKGEIYCVLGCGGERDVTKRPLMAKLSTQYADFSIFTSDNPRSENPQTILDDMVEGVKNYVSDDRYISFVDRKEAIEYALSMAKKDDCVMLLGKGHETYQIIGEEKVHFDDKEIALEFLKREVMNVHD